MLREGVYIFGARSHCSPLQLIIETLITLNGFYQNYY
jgi:hypothetical protein